MGPFVLAAWDTTNETERAQVCYREYVSAKDCDAWVEDQLARRAARKKDEAERGEERNRSYGGNLTVLASAMFLPALDTANETVRAEICHKEYVSAKDCDAWVADQLERKAARKADEAKRKAAREADEEKRRQERNSTNSQREFLAASRPGAMGEISTVLVVAVAAGVSMLTFMRSWYSRRVGFPSAALG